MYIYDNITSEGIHIHLSMSESKDTNYIFFHNIFNGVFMMKYFTDVTAAMEFIHSIKPHDD